jgi:hypothetical protein
VTSRRDGWWFIAFALLVVVGSAVVSLPSSDAPPSAIAGFYADHRAAVVVTQLLGLAGVAVLLRVLVLLRRRVVPRGGRAELALTLSGLLVAGASALTALPVLVLALDSGLDADATRSWARFADVTDDILFGTVAVFAAVLAVLLQPRWVRLLAGAVALLAAVRAVGSPLGLSALDVVAPLAFLVLVVVLGIRLLATGEPAQLSAPASWNLLARVPSSHPL